MSALQREEPVLAGSAGQTDQLFIPQLESPQADSRISVQQNQQFSVPAPSPSFFCRVFLLHSSFSIIRHIAPLSSPDISLTFLRCFYFGLNRHTFCLCSLHFPVGSGLEEGFSLLTVAAQWGDTNQDLWTFAHHSTFKFCHWSVFTLCVFLNAVTSFSFLCSSLRLPLLCV